MEKLPSEILLIIFSYLDKKSRKSATATCQLWFDVIRNSNLSNHICFKGIVEELQQRIENLEWDWKRWPALKTFELKGFFAAKEDLLNDLPIDFKQCPTLEIVIFDVDEIDITTDLFPKCPQNVAIIYKLAFNPQLDITQFGVDHIWSLYILRKNDEVFKLINENVKGLKELWVNKLSYLNDLVCKDALLELHIYDDHNSSELKIDGLKKLKTLKVHKFAHLDNFSGIDALLELGVTSVSRSELKKYDLSNITKRFKNLQKCEINVDDIIDGLNPEKYEQIVQDVFQDSATSVKIVFENDFSENDYWTTYLTKEPFQRCFVTRSVVHGDLDLDSNVLESDD